MKVNQVRIGNNHLFKVPIAPITFLPEETQSGIGAGRLCRGPTCVLGAGSLGKLVEGVVHWQRVTRRDWLEVHIWWSLIGSKLEVGSKIRDATGYESNPSCLGPIVTGVVVRLPGCLLETVV